MIDGHYRLSEKQAQAILELRLQRLTGMERDKLPTKAELAERILDYLDILGSATRLIRLFLTNYPPPVNG